MNLRMKITLYVLLIGAVCDVGFGQVVEMPDSNLRRAVREALNLPAGAPITQADMLKLTELDARDSRIQNLTGLEYATNLISLRLNGNQIEGISPLANLTHLKVLRLDHNNIVDISALANLTQLIELHLDSNRIGNINPLVNLTYLKFVRLDGNDIADISPLAHLTQLIDLLLDGNRIENISPLTHLTQLTKLHLSGNRIMDVSPLANLTQLTKLHLSGNRIVDVSPLANLRDLTHLRLSRNGIVDVSPLVNLTQLTELLLDDNRIVDVITLSSLTNLDSLNIQLNPVADYNLLNGLALTHFLYDEWCELPPLPIHDRLENRRFPSVFKAWGTNVLNRPELSEIENLVSHDLWVAPRFNLRTENTVQGLRFVGSLQDVIQQRDELLARNPNMVFLALVPLVAFLRDAYPDDWPHWVRDVDGNRLSLSPHSDFIDVTHPEVQDIIVGIALAAEQCGLFDGIFLDVAREDFHFLRGYRSHEEEVAAKENILRRIRAESSPDFLIMVNVNRKKIPRTGAYVNGLFLESSVPGLQDSEGIEKGLSEIESTLLWADDILNEPHIHALDGSALDTEPPDSPTNLRWMRAMTTLSLTHSDGYVLFSTNVYDFNHYWYDFWNADLGRPVSEEKAQLYNNREGLYIREYTNGWAVYNHSGEPQVITLPEKVQGVASGLVNTEHALPNLDGEMYLRVKPKNPADVNGDGVVNILDLTIIARGLGTDRLEADVNGDGFVNILDLVFVANAF